MTNVTKTMHQCRLEKPLPTLDIKINLSWIVCDNILKANQLGIKMLISLIWSGAIVHTWLSLGMIDNEFETCSCWPQLLRTIDINSGRVRFTNPFPAQVRTKCTNCTGLCRKTDATRMQGWPNCAQHVLIRIWEAINRFPSTKWMQTVNFPTDYRSLIATLSANL